MSFTRCSAALTASTGYRMDDSQRPPIYGVIDCDNFFASCERVFNPALATRPIAVLSNNDGCIIARSAEVKALGIEMGVAVHKVDALLREHNVIVCSANFLLYADLSRRVFELLATFTPDIEIYSIDEVFIRLDTIVSTDYADYARTIREEVLRQIGIPVSIGLGHSKTLAKIAAKVAKKQRRCRGVYDLYHSSSQERKEVLANTTVDKVWGIGRQLSRWLQSRGIATAYDLQAIDPEWFRKKAGITGVRLVHELRGIPCLPLADLVVPRKTITCSSSFGKPVETLAELNYAVSTFCCRAARKLREDGSVAAVMQVFFHTNPFSTVIEQFKRSGLISLVPPSNHDADLIRAAHAVTSQLFEPGHPLYKAGIVLADITPASARQADLFVRPDYAKITRLDQTLDRINEQHGPGTIRAAAVGTSMNWRSKSSYRSRRFTSDWNDLPQAG